MAANPTLTGVLVAPRTEAGPYAALSTVAGVFGLPVGADTSVISRINFAGLTRASVLVSSPTGTVNVATRIVVTLRASRIVYVVYDVVYDQAGRPTHFDALPAPMVGEELTLFIVTGPGQLAGATVRPILFASAF